MFVRSLEPGIVVAADEPARYLPSPPQHIATLALRLGFGETVSPLSGAEKTKDDKCSGPGEVLVMPFLKEENGNRFCITASSAGLNVHFVAAIPFVTSSKLLCVKLHGPPEPPSSNLITVIARSGRLVKGEIVYDGGRAECNVGTGFAYALSAETQSNSNLIPAGLDGGGKARTVTVPWKLLLVNQHTTSVMIAVNVCAAKRTCTNDLTEIQIPVTVVNSSAFLSLQYAPYSVVGTAAPAPNATPMRLHRVGVDGTYSWDEQNVIMASFAQDQSGVGTQRAFSQALGLTALALPTIAPQMAISQTLQTRSQGMFAFQKASDSLSDQSLRPFFDTQPYSVNKLGSLASGYVYGYDSEQLKASAVYGNQAQGYYSGAESLTFVFTNPSPSPEPSPQAKQPGMVKVSAAAPLPLQPPPVPAPFVEANAANDPPLQLGFIDSYVGSKGARDAVDAFAARVHVFANQAATYDGYHSLNADVFGEVQENQPGGTASAPPSSSNFAGESTTFTTASTGDRASFLQIRETLGAQIDDYRFSPTAGSVTWLAPLSGPLAHVAASTAQSESGRFYALDLFGFRLTNTLADFASEEGIQGTVPVPTLTGWLVTGGTQTQVVSDRIAALEQGLVSSYVSAIPEVLPTPSAGKSEPSPRRNQKLSNVLLQSPWQQLITPAVNFEFVLGYNTGLVTGCNTAPHSKAKAPLYECSLEHTDHVVGGAFFQIGDKLNFGATDTPALSSNVGNGLSSLSASHNVGTTGGLPGSVTAYFTYVGCPQVAVSYANAAFPSGVPLPQQGTTFSGELDYPIIFRAQQIDFAAGYYNELPVSSSAQGSSGAFAAIRWSVQSPMPQRRC
jgi:hypothetical protein